MGSQCGWRGDCYFSLLCTISPSLPCQVSTPMSVFLPFRLSVRPSVRPSVRLSVCPSRVSRLPCEILLKQKERKKPKRFFPVVDAGGGGTTTPSHLSTHTCLYTVRVRLSLYSGVMLSLCLAFSPGPTSYIYIYIYIYHLHTYISAFKPRSGRADRRSTTCVGRDVLEEALDLPRLGVDVDVQVARSRR